ncbi:hypothetical protein CCAND93_980004 [Capnocytophaga canis]|uniref:Uncharacterized protein n=1 Tax=Capnocytophaga canis TaxID=1848903 RepID=A0A0B7IWY0_9FLAO|nr:hypothetical protein CCAND93_980004 [Capnocytophaga canis]
MKDTEKRWTLCMRITYSRLSFGSLQPLSEQANYVLLKVVF